MMRPFTKSILGLFALALIVAATGCGDEKKEPAKTQEAPLPAVKVTPVINYTMVARYPHDITSFTEGFLFHNGKLFESTGSPDYLSQTRSAFGVVDLKTGKMDVKAELDRKAYFGEGIAVLNNLLYQITYTTQVGFIYDTKTFERKGQFGYMNKEGWGMTTDGESLIFSDGTSNLTYLETKDFKVVKTLTVTEGGYGLYNLNELEYINGYIYANIWMTNRIVKIDPKTGEVVEGLDLTALYNQSRSRNNSLAEMNGIAWDPVTDKILITGKLWPDIYEISFPH